MHHQTRDDRIRSPVRRAPSRSSSLGSDRSHSSRLSALQAPPVVSPPPAFVALSAASQAATDSQAARLYDDDNNNNYDAASITSADYQQAIFTERALSMINGFLDQILFSSITAARGTTLAAIRPATEQVLKGKLAREAFAAAEEELEDLLAGADGDQDDATPQPTPTARSFDHELVWKRTRLRVMVYTRLGEMEDDDEERFIEEAHLLDGSNSKGFSPDAGLVSWAAAIFMTSILEFIAEQCIFVAANAAFDRHNARTQDAEPVEAEAASDDRVHISEHDVEKIALNPVLNRLWRTWRKGLRQSRSFASGAASSARKPLHGRLLNHKKSRSEVAKSATAPAVLPKRQHSFSAFSTPPQALGIQPPMTRALQRRRSHGDAPLASAVRQALSKDKAKRRRSLPPNNAVLLSTASLRGFQTHPPATIGPKLGHFRSSTSSASPRAESPVTPSSARHASWRGEPKAMSPRTSTDTTRGPRELKLAAKQFSARSSPDFPATTPPLHSEIKRLSAEKPAPVPEESPIAEEVSQASTDAPVAQNTTAAQSVLVAPVEMPADVPAPAPVSAPVRVPMLAPIALPVPVAAAALVQPSEEPHTKEAALPQEQPTAQEQPPVAAQAPTYQQSPRQVVEAQIPVAQPARVVQEAPEIIQQASALEQPVQAPQPAARELEITQPPAVAQQPTVSEQAPMVNGSATAHQSIEHATPVAETSAFSSERPSEDTARKPAALPRLSTQSSGSRWSSQSGGSDMPYVSRFMEGSPVLENPTDASRFSASGQSSKSTQKHDSATSETMMADQAWRRKKYVDPEAPDRASVQRLSTASSVRMSRGPEAYRTRDMSANSLASRVRDGAESRQSINSSGAHSEAMERDFDELIAGAEPVKYTLTPGALRKLESPVESATTSNWTASPSSNSGNRLSAALSSLTSIQSNKSPPSSFSAHMAARDGNQVLAPINEPKSLVTSGSRSSSGKPSNVGVPRDARAVPASTRDMSDFLKSSQPSPSARGPLESIGEIAHTNRYVSAPTSTRVSRRPSISSPADAKEQASARPASSDRPRDNAITPAPGQAGTSGVKKKTFVPRDPIVRRVDQDELISFLRDGPTRSPANGSSGPRGASSLVSTNGNRSSSATTFSHADSFSSQSRLVGQAPPIVKKQSRVRDMYSTDFVDEDDDEMLMGMGRERQSTHEESLMEFLRTSAPPAARDPPKPAPVPAPAPWSQSGSVSTSASRSASPLPSNKPRRQGWFSRTSSRDRIPQEQSSVSQMQISSTPPMLPMPGYLGGGDDSSYETQPAPAASTPAAAPAPNVNHQYNSVANGAGPGAKGAGYARERESGKKMPFWKRLGTAY